MIPLLKRRHPTPKSGDFRMDVVTAFLSKLIAVSQKIFVFLTRDIISLWKHHRPDYGNAQVPEMYVEVNCE
jgi:hypothetical protein